MVDTYYVLVKKKGSEEWKLASVEAAYSSALRVTKDIGQSGAAEAISEIRIDQTISVWRNPNA